jgi:hypothetical protein
MRLRTANRRRRQAVDQAVERIDYQAFAGSIYAAFDPIALRYFASTVAALEQRLALLGRFHPLAPKSDLYAGLPTFEEFRRSQIEQIAAAFSGRLPPFV